MLDKFLFFKRPNLSYNMYTIHSYIVEVLDFLMGYESHLRKRRDIGLKEALQSDRKTSSFVTLVSSLSRLFACKVVDVFCFHLQIFHWFVAPPSRRYFQGHSS
jgi:hypothetical protein